MAPWWRRKASRFAYGPLGRARRDSRRGRASQPRSANRPKAVEVELQQLADRVLMLRHRSVRDVHQERLAKRCPTRHRSNRFRIVATGGQTGLKKIPQVPVEILEHRNFALQSRLELAFAPPSDLHAPDTELLGDLLVLQALRRQQHDLRTLSQPDAGALGARQLRQLAFLFFRQINCRGNSQLLSPMQTVAELRRRALHLSSKELNTTPALVPCCSRARPHTAISISPRRCWRSAGAGTAPRRKGRVQSRALPQHCRLRQAPASGHDAHR